MGAIEFYFLTIFRLFLQFVSKIVYFIKNWNFEHKTLPPITNKLVLESAVSLAEKIRSREVSSEEVVIAFIDRIKEVNTDLNAVVEYNFSRAWTEAVTVDIFLRENPDVNEELLKTKPFYGVPFTAKETFQVKGLHHTSGLYAKKDVIPDEDGPPIKSIKNAGGIIIGTTNVPELAMWWETNNTIYGETNNPYAFNRSAGGSTGGEGSIICAAGSPIGIGSDLGGSLRVPAYFCGIFSHKTSAGIKIEDGLLPVLTGELDKLCVIGPVSKFAKDLRPMLKLLIDPNKQYLTDFDRKVDLKDLNIFYMEDNGGSPWTIPVDREVKSAVLKTVEYFKTVYNVPCKKVKVPQMDKAIDMLMCKIASEKSMIPFSLELGNREKHVNIFWEIVKICLGRKSVHTSYALAFGAFLKLFSPELRPSHCKSVLEGIKEMKIFFKDLLKENCIFIYPPQPTAAIYHKESLFKLGSISYTSVFNMVELPVTQCPVGLNSFGLPLGVQVVGGLYQDDLCLTVAEEIERAFGGWVCPCEVKLM